MRLVLHSSPTRLVLGATTPVVLGLLAVPALGGAWPWLGGVLLLTAVVSAGVVLLDVPLRTEFDEDGFVRVCALRRQRIPWSEVVAIERTVARPPRSRRAEDPGEGQPRHDTGPRPSQGLTARTGPRRVLLLVDRCESQREWEALRDLVGARATVVRAARPRLDSTPAGRGPEALHRR